MTVSDLDCDQIINSSLQSGDMPPATESGIIDSQKICHGCRNIIVERYYLLVGDRSWHQLCLRCQVCQRGLNDEITCYDKLGRIYCRDDYAKLFGAHRTCSRCQERILPSEMVMKVRSCIFHLACFSCFSCSRQLCPGEHFGMDAERVFCRHHFELLRDQWPSEDAEGSLITKSEPDEAVAPTKHSKGRPRKKRNMKIEEEEPERVESPQSSVLPLNCSTDSAIVPPSSITPGGSGGYEAPGSVGTSVEDCGLDGSSMVGSPDRSSGPGSNSGGSSHPQRQKRVRTSFKHHQLRTMKSYFAINHNPDAKDLKQLAEKTGLSKRVLQVWFQNARAKFRRSLMKHQSGDVSGGQSSPAHKLTSSGEPTAHVQLCGDSGGALASLHRLDHVHGTYLTSGPCMRDQCSPSRSDASSNASLPDLAMTLDLPTSGPHAGSHRVPPMSLNVY